MADNNSKLIQTPEYKTFADNIMQYSNGEEPSLEVFLNSMTPQKREDFLNKYKEDPLDNVIDMDRARSMYSDQNEIWLDRIRVNVLKSMGVVDAAVDVNTIPVENLLEEVQKADKLEGEKKTAYLQSVEENLRNEINFSIVPPKTLVSWAKRLDNEINETKQKNSKADVSTKEAILTAVNSRMDNLINDMAEQTGLYMVDQTNIADVHDGYVEMIQYRGDKNKSGPAAADILKPKINAYDEITGLAGKTEADATKLQEIATDTAEKIKGFMLSEESLKIAQSLDFRDDKGVEVLQFLDDAGKPAATGNKIRPGTQLETLVNAAMSDAMDDQVLLVGKKAEKDALNSAVNEAFQLNATMMINADRIGNREKPVKFDVLRNDLLNGKSYKISAAGFEGATDAYVNKKTSKLARLGQKIGKNALVLGTLYQPVSKIDKLEKARFGEDNNQSKYRRQFWTGLAGNALLVGGISASFAIASKIPGAQPYCVAASAGLAVVGMTLAYQQRRRAAHAENKKYNFFKDPEGMTSVLMSGAALAAVAWGRPEGLYAVLGANMVRTGYFAHKKAKQAGIKSGEAALMTLAAVATTPLAAWGGREAGNAIGDALSAPNGPLGHWIHEDGKTVPGKETHLRNYEQKHIDKAELWNNSDGQQTNARFTPDGSHPMESAFHKTDTYDDALLNVRSNHVGWDSQAADVNLAKLENAHLLGAPNTPLAHDPSRTLGDVMGAVDPSGKHVTYEDVFKHLTTDPKIPLTPTEAKVLDLVALHISADVNGHMGHLIPDVGIKPQDLYSYDPSRPDGILIETHKGPDYTTPGSDTWVPNPDDKIIPFIPPYFFAQVQKLKQIKDKIGSLADRIMKKNKQKKDPTPPPSDKDKIGIDPDDKDKNKKDVVPGKIGRGNPDPNDPSTWNYNRIQGDNTFFGSTSGQVSGNEIKDLDDHPLIGSKKDGKNVAASAMLNHKQMKLLKEEFQNRDFRTATTFKGLTQEEQDYLKMMGMDPASEMKEIKERKEELQNSAHPHKDKMSGVVVADRFAEEGIHGVEMKENIPEEYKRVEKQREADKQEFKTTGKIARFMQMFKKER